MSVTTRSQSARARVVAAIKGKTTKLGQSTITSAKSVGTKTSRPGRSHGRASLKTTLKEAIQSSYKREAQAQIIFEIQKTSRKRQNDKKRASKANKIQTKTTSKRGKKETWSYQTAKGSRTGAARKVSQRKPVNVRRESDGGESEGGESEGGESDGGESEGGESDGVESDKSSEKRTLGYVFILQMLDSMRNETDFYKIEFSEEQPNDNDFGSEFKRIPDSEPIKVLCINKVKGAVAKFLKAVKDTCPYEDGLYKVSPTVFDTFMVQYNKCIEPYKCRD